MPNNQYGTNRVRADGTRVSRPYAEQTERLDLAAEATVATQMRGGSKNFTHLHLHTEMSSLDGLGSIQQYVDRAVELGMTHLGITDHGVVSGHPQFYKSCRKAGIEPVLGEEFYFVDDVDWRPPKKVKGEVLPEQRQGDEEGGERAHFTCLAVGPRGYEVLAELSTEAHRHFYKKPIVDKSILEALGRDARHLVVFSGCAASMISRAILSDEMELAEERLQWWREIFPNFYIEHMHHDTEFDMKLNLGLQQLAQKYSVPWVITNDPHYVLEEECGYHDALLAIQTASDIDDPNRFRFDGSGYHLRSRNELRRLFLAHYGETVWKQGAAATNRIAQKCKVRMPAWESRTWQFPTYAPARGDSYGVLRKLAYRGLRRRGLRDEPEYVDRVRHELSVFKEVGIADFLLITRACVVAAQDGGMHPELGPIPVGPGRGSVCGSLVAMLIGIHKIDPIRYKLRFDRFLNPARPKMPDVDTDFGQARRDEMFEWASQEFGEENVVHVAAYQSLKVKAAFQSLARAFGISYPDRIRISKMLNDDEENAFALPEEVREAYPDLFNLLRRISGVKKGVSQHAAGIVIADPELNIKRVVPQMWIASSKKFVGQYDLTAVEDLGLLKEDFLGLRTLDTIQECLKIIEATTGETFDPDEWWPDHEPNDDRVYKLLADGHTAGIFQMEGPTNTRGIKEIQPTCFEDIVSCTSLYRTGAISAGFPEIFLKNRRRGSVRRIKYVHQGLKPILETTWGVVLYQEQVMDMAEQLAGFDGAQLADIIEAIKHKSGPLMQSMKSVFIRGCMRHTAMSKKQAAECWRMIEGYSGYGYNRSHAVAYSFTTYQTARLRALWPKQYMTAMIRTCDTSSKEGKAKMEGYMREAIRIGLRISPPCINDGGIKATLVLDENRLRLGHTAINGIGMAAAKKIEDNRPESGYTSFQEITDAVKNKGAMEKLEIAGALECVGGVTTMDAQSDICGWQFKDRMRRFRTEYANDLNLPTNEVEEEEVTIIGEIVSIDRRKTKTDKDYVKWRLRFSPTEIYDVQLWSETARHWNLIEGSVVMISGKWQSRWMNISCGNPRQIRVIRRKIHASTA